MLQEKIVISCFTINNLVLNKLVANVTVPQHAWGPDFLPIYVSSSFRYIIVNDFNGSNTSITTQCTISNLFLWPSLPLGGPKIQSKGYFWHVSILSPVEKKQAKPIKKCLVVWNYECSPTIINPTGYTKKFNSLRKQWVTKKWYITQIYPFSIFLLFSLNADYHDTYFLKAPLS